MYFGSKLGDYKTGFAQFSFKLKKKMDSYTMAQKF